MKIKDQGFYIIRKDEEIEMAPVFSIPFLIALFMLVFAFLYSSYFLAQNHEPMLLQNCMELRHTGGFA